MIKIGTILDVLDNTNISKVKCISSLKFSKKKYLNIGDIIVVFPFKSKNLAKKEKLFAIIATTKYGLQRKDGSTIKFPINGVIIIKLKVPEHGLVKDNIIANGTRVLYPVAREIKNKFPNLSGIITKFI